LREVKPGEFRRQEPIGSYIVDFVSYKKKLIIEVDGGQHNESAGMARDEERSKWLASQGFRVVRFWNNDVMRNIDGVMAEVLKHL
jgi:very-short-patch-repair endonuclease